MIGFQDISKKDVGDFSIRGCDCLYPSVLLKYYAIGLSDRAAHKKVALWDSPVDFDIANGFFALVSC